jgi:hypothetical protein
MSISVPGTTTPSTLVASTLAPSISAPNTLARRVLIAGQRSLKNGDNLSLRALRQHGATGGDQEIKMALEELIAAGELTPPTTAYSGLRDRLRDGSQNGSQGDLQGGSRGGFRDLSSEVLGMVLRAAEAALVDGKRPGIDNLRDYGARGDNNVLSLALRKLIASGQIIMPPRKRRHVGGMKRPVETTNDTVKDGVTNTDKDDTNRIGRLKRRQDIRDYFAAERRIQEMGKRLPKQIVAAERRLVADGEIGLSGQAWALLVANGGKRRE